MHALAGQCLDKLKQSLCVEAVTISDFVITLTYVKHEPGVHTSDVRTPQ